MKLVHAADLHLDSPLRGLERYEGAPVERIRGAVREAFEALVRLCLEESVDLLVIAGDLFDGDWRDYNTGLFFVSRVGELTRAGIRVVWVRGNHDAASRISGRMVLPKGAFELDTREPQTLVLEDLGVALHGQSYERREVWVDLAARYPRPLSGLFNLGILHTALDGREGHAPYAPCSLDRLRSHGYDYWALGHVHRRDVLCSDPWVVFPGNLQGRHARETGPKGATLVRIEDGVVTAVEARTLDVVRWIDLAVEARGAASSDDVVDLVRLSLERECEELGDRMLAARVRIAGASRADVALRARPEHWVQQIRSAALDVGAPVWIEKVYIDTRADASAAAALAHDDPLHDLMQALSAAARDPELLSEVQSALAPLANKLPPEYRALTDALDLKSAASLARLLDGVERELLPRLLELRSPS